MTMPQDREAVAADAEEQRQRAQAQADQDNKQAERDSADFRGRQAEHDANIDPNSPEGRQAAMRRGDPVQLRGDDAARGRVEGTNPTGNESPAQPLDVAEGEGWQDQPQTAQPVVQGGPEAERQRQDEAAQDPNAAQPDQYGDPDATGDSGDHGPGVTQ